jgi:hypothetical protein
VHYHASTGRGALPFQLPRQKFRRTVRGKKMLAPPVGLLSLLRWARGPQSVPCTLGTPAHHLQVESRGRVYIHELSHVLRLRILPPCIDGSGATTRPAAPNPTSLLGRALALLYVPLLWSSPPCSEGLRCWHASRDTLWVVNKEILRHKRRAERLAHYRGVSACYRGTCKTCRQTMML